jgi:hypothetical protein
MNMMTDLKATGLNPIVIDEDTDMASLPTLNVAPDVTAVDKLLAGSKALAKAVDKVRATDEATADQRLNVQMDKEAVTAALTGDGDFAAASKAFQASNNKLDKLLEQREAMLANAKAGLKALRDHLDLVADQLRDLED